MPPDPAQLYDQHAPAVFAFLLNVTRREADSRDVLQELFLKIVARPSLLDGVRAPRAFLLRLAHRLAIDAHRRRSTHERAVAESPALFAPSIDPDEDSFRAALAAALGDLPEEQRAVVHLKLWEQIDLRGHRRRARHSPEHRRQPLPLRPRQTPDAAASPLRGTPMNDFERKLSQQPFRQAPADLRAAIFGADANVIAPEPWTWQDWFWPSPLAWAALAMIWGVLNAVETPARNVARASAALRSGDQKISRQAFLSFARDRDRLLAELARNRLTPEP